MNKDSFMIHFHICSQNFRIVTNNKLIFQFLKNEYFIDDKELKPFYEINITQQKDAFKISSKDITISYNLSTDSDLYLYVIEYFLRYIIEQYLIKDNILLIHGSSFVYKGKAYLFVGTSGAGKSTIVSKSNLSNRLADDTVVIFFKNKIPYVYQTPFEKIPFNNHKDRKFKIAKIFKIIQSKQNKTERLSTIEKLYTLMNSDILIMGFNGDYKVNSTIATGSDFDSLSKQHYTNLIQLIESISIENLFFTKDCNIFSLL
jgi:hypothetical protein